MEKRAGQRGGSFLIEEIAPGDVFTPEDFTESHAMIIKLTEDFVKNEVVPCLDKLEHKDFELTRGLMLKAGELGLLGADVSERYQGTALDKIASTLITDYSAGAASFAITWGCHTGIGSLPLVFFGNKAQKAKYLSSMARGIRIGAYALTEPSAGSDALSIKTTAKLSNDGKYYILNGEKQFITNGGIADIIFTYAKVDGDKFTGFIVEKDFQGVSVGPEEKKMGIRGSSTTPVIFQDALVPAENVLFEIGQGHTVAFCILDIGRFKLAAGCVGRARTALEESLKYAKQRVQFGRPISDFGLIKEKLAEMAIRTYIGESMVYRTAGLLDGAFQGVDVDESSGRENARRISDYTVECSVNKVYCSEMLGYVTDEAVQVHGGYGYIEDYPVERMYRDSRINRIFEGTNEINRILMPGWVLRKAQSNEMPLFSLARKLMAEVPTLAPASPGAGDGSLGYQRKLLDMAKKVFILTCGAAAQKYGAAIEQEEEVLGCLSNIMIEIYTMESGLLRALKSIASVGEEKSGLKTSMASVYVNDAMRRIDDYATRLLAAIESGDALQMQLAVLRKLTRVFPMNTVAAMRGIASRIIDAERYLC